MRKNAVSCKHRLEYLFFRLFILALKLSPVALMRFHAALLRGLVSLAGRSALRRVTMNLRLAYPEKTEREIQALKRRILRHFSTMFTQILYLYSRKNPHRILPEIEIRNGDEMKRLLKRGRGVIVFTAHFGNWELIPYLMNRELGIRMTNIAREMDNPLIERIVTDFRRFMGSKILFKKGSIRTLLRDLDRNRVVGIIIDQHTLPREGVFVDFFGHPVSTISSVSQLHLKKKSPVVPVFLHYENRRIVMDIGDELVFVPGPDHQKNLIELTQVCTRRIEEEIRRYPEQWFWFHNRWKSTPRGENHEEQQPQQ